MKPLPPRALTLSYIVALSVVALLSLASHLVLGEILRANEGSAAVINESGRQRMLSQRIAGLALELRSGDESARPVLRQAIDKFGSAHRDLVAIANDGSGISPDLKAIYYGGQHLDRRMTGFLDAAKRVAATSAKADARPMADPDLALLIGEARAPLLTDLDAVVRLHQNESEHRARQLQTIQWAILAIVLVTLLLEALFIFRPMVLRITDYVRQILRLVEIDYLTNIYNRRAFIDRAGTELERARRHERPLSVLLIDIDHFKQINDSFGHHIGDEVLVTIARRMRDAMRRHDVVGRFGGEEFAVMLPETEHEMAATMAERLRLIVCSEPVITGADRIDVTVSIGVAQVAVKATAGMQDALKTADALLYEAKRAGRNCVRAEPAAA